VHLTKLSLVHISHLYQCAVFLIKKNLHTLHVPINSCEQSSQQPEDKREREEKVRSERVERKNDRLKERSSKWRKLITT